NEGSQVNSQENLKVGSRIRIAKRDNVDKYEKGRFSKTGIIVEKCGHNSFLVKDDLSGRIIKRGLKDIKL
ncbi:hypothetical protein COBT_003622, partial [Conglomerata obtusa]